MPVNLPSLTAGSRRKPAPRHLEFQDMNLAEVGR